MRWSAAARGAPQANSRRGLCRPATLKESPSGTSDLLIHEVLADEVAGYMRQSHVVAGGIKRARDLNLWLSSEASTLVVDRLPGQAVYPSQSGPARLFTLL